MAFEKAPGESAQNDFERNFMALNALAADLKQGGFQIVPHFLTRDFVAEQAKKRMSIPVVRDGGDGIQVRFEPGEGVVIDFRHNFADPENPRRKEAENLLRQKGYLH